jgi:hypothetical protein
VADDRERREDAGELRDGYERLRSAVLSGSASGWRLGHGVLSARGTAGWMLAFGELAPPASGGTAAAPRCSSESRRSSAGHPGSLPDADQVVAVLAQMTLAIAA